MSLRARFTEGVRTERVRSVRPQGGTVDRRGGLRGVVGPADVESRNLTMTNLLFTPGVGCVRKIGRSTSMSRFG